MAAQDCAQPFVLLGYRLRHASSGLDPQLMQFANLPLPLRLSFDDEPSLSAGRSVVGEAEKFERLGPPLPDPATPFGGILAEHDQPGLVLMKRKAKLDQPLGEVDQHLPSIRLAFEGHHK